MPLKTKIAVKKGKSSTAAFERLLKQADRVKRYVLRLYVTGTTTRSSQAISNVRSLCDEYLGDNYDLEVVDIYQQPDAVRDEQIIAAPTLIKKFPEPPRRMVGDLADRDRVIIGLNLSSKTKWVKL